jgi:hypothetical protein
MHHAIGFFEGLEPMEGAIAAIQEMKAQGIRTSYDNLTSYLL